MFLDYKSILDCGDNIFTDACSNERMHQLFCLILLFYFYYIIYYFFTCIFA